MADRNPLEKIKDVAVGAVKTPLTVAGTVAGSAAGLAKDVAGKTVGAVAAVVSGGDMGAGATGAATQEKRPPAEATSGEASRETSGETSGDTTEETADDAAPTLSGPISPTEPINVTEELGLDPAPVEKPKRTRRTTKPTTKIDAAADPSEVDVTPADVAKAVGKGGPDQG